MSDVPAIARVCHEANRAWQLATGDPAPSLSWDEAPEWQRASALEGVEAALRGSSPRELHNSWVRSKIDAGWTYGPTKDDQALTHPCLVRYEQLPPEQRAKDVLFGSIVEALADV